MRTRGRAALVVALASCHPARIAPPTMPTLVTSPADADAEPIPGGVAAPDGSELYVHRGAGIDAIDPDTGAVRWTTTAAVVPVLALPDIVLAVAAGSAGDVTWTGPARLVAIDRAPPHAARTGPPFVVPAADGDFLRPLDARVRGGALEVWWFIAPRPRSALAEQPPPLDGSLRIDLATGAATVADRGWVPDALRAQLAGVTVWSAVGDGFSPWRAGDGWSVVVVVPDGATSVPSLRHWPSSGPATTAPLLAPHHIGRAEVEHANRHHLFLRVCEPDAPPDCALRVIDTVTGALLATTPSPPPRPSPSSPSPSDVRLEPPYALYGRQLLAARTRGSARAVVAFDLDRGERWQLPLLPARAAPP